MAGINPCVDIDNYNENIPTYYSVKRLFELQNYSKYKFFVYGIDEQNQSAAIPAESDSFYFWSCGSAIGWTSGASPLPFISDSAWGDYGQPGIVNSPCGVIDPSINAIMPKLLIPSKELVDNGIEIGEDEGIYGEHRGVFNWSISQINDVDFTASSEEEVLGYLNTSGGEGSKYVSLDYKSDVDSSANIKLHCAVNPERLADLEAYAATPESLVGQGACLIMAYITPVESGGDESDSSGKSWSMDIEFPSGELRLSLNETGSLNVDINGNITKVQLQASMAKEQPPQYQKLGGKIPYCIVITPAWNGVVISDGVQDALDGSVKSQYCLKNKDAHVTDEVYFGSPFDPIIDLGKAETLWGTDGSGNPLAGGSTEAGGDSPTDLSFQVDAPLPPTANSVGVEFGTDLSSGLDITFTGCKASFAYLPLFFFPELKFDQYYQTTEDSGDFRYWEWAYPVWTNNNGTFKMVNYNIDETYTNPSAGNGAIYGRMEYYGTTGSEDYWDRYGGEIFGQYFQNDENQHVVIFNGDGSYPLTTFWNSASGDVSGDPSPLSGWKNYIESISTSIGLDSASGSITVDKYGIAGQRAQIEQNIGSLKILAYGNYPGDFTTQWTAHGATSFGKQSGTNDILFTGIAMGAGESEGSDGATFSIPLESRNKKLEDLMLLNAPFFDGYELGDVLDYLCKYGGLLFNHTNQYHGNPSLLTTPVLASESVNSPAIDFQAGTSVHDALNQICELTKHSFYIKRDGKIHFYELGDDGLPVSPGYDWSDLYGPTDYTFIMNSRDNTPDFEDLRNEIVGICQTSANASGTDIKNIPLFPLNVLIENTTVPEFPWSKRVVWPIRGVLTSDQLTDILTDKVKKLASRYLLSGSITVAGNPYIEPYDQWTIEDLTYIVESVSQSMDFNSKTWTTSVTLFGAT